MTSQNILSQFQIVQATLDDYSTIQNMARFYVYDMSRSCGFISEEWACPADGLYESYDFKTYFTDPKRQAFLIKVKNELAGFVLLKKVETKELTYWNVGEFFILAKFQGSGLGCNVAHKLWTTYPGMWELSVIPENKPALAFWRKTVTGFTKGDYTETLKDVDYDSHQNQRYYLSFDSRNQVANPDSGLNQFKITVVDSLSDEVTKRMTDGFIAYETRHNIDVNYKCFSLIISNEENAICGALNAYTAFSEIYVDDIWVDSDYRGKGYGRALLQGLEERFKGKGFNNINLVTSAFQAPEFYKKCGFIAEFTRVNKVNPLLTKTFFVKFFDDKVQTQGLLVLK